MHMVEGVLCGCSPCITDRATVLVRVMVMVRIMVMRSVMVRVTVIKP